jgi:MFS family permease
MTTVPEVPWYRGLTGRQWTVLAIAWMGWVFDIMDVFIFVHAREKLFKELAPEQIGLMSSLAFSVTLAGWAIGGVLFGVVADRWGRSKTMALTILMYSVFTGLAGCSQSAWQFILLRFLAALGIGLSGAASSRRPRLSASSWGRSSGSSSARTGGTRSSRERRRRCCR